MLRKYLVIPVFILLALISYKTSAQDFHLTQYDAATLYLNPALTGCYFNDKIDLKVYADYRSQWKSLSGTPFSTAFLAVDMKKNRYGIGAYLINNRAGSGGLNTLNFLFSSSYRITENEGGPHFLLVGFQAGVLNKSFNPEKYTFDNQYSASASSGFDNTLSNQENFDKTNILKIDANMGVYYKYQDKYQTIHPYFGFSSFHLTMPDVSVNDLKRRIPVRFLLNGGTEIELNEKLRLNPGAIYMKQGSANELNIGVLGYYKLMDSDYEIILGTNYRVRDAVILQFGIKQNNNIFRISYDANTSNLSSFSNDRGGIEFSLILSRNKGEGLAKF